MAEAPGGPAREAPRRRRWPLVIAFTCIVAFQVVVATLSIELMSSVRAYVTGESLYSKGQKDAQIYLHEYAEHLREQDYQRFLQALAVPLGDRAAREELAKATFDPALARQGFLAGGNHPEDIDGMIRLFRWFRHVPFMADPIRTWTEADAVIAQMHALVERTHAQVIAGDDTASAVRRMRELAPLLNQRLTELERQFSAQLGEASRRTQALLLAANVSLGVLLALTGLGFMWRAARRQTATERELRQREESLQRLLDSAAEGLFGVDLQGRCTFINRAALRMLGYAHESELIGGNVHALIHHSGADGLPRPLAESRVSRAYLARERQHVTDEVFWRRDDSSFPVEYWSHPVLQDGVAEGAVLTFFDISERLAMQAALREGALRMARLVDAVTDAVVTVDEAGCVVLFNRSAERLFGVAAGEAIGSALDRFIPHGAPPWPEPAAEAAAAGGKARPAGVLHELTGLRADGASFPIEASLSTLQTEQGRLVTIVLRDVTDQHAAREERRALDALEASSRAKTEFLSRMSHELRTPLNAVLGFSQLMRMDFGRADAEQQRERLRHIENAGAHLLALVNDVLDLAGVESGRMTMAPEAVELRSVAEDALAMVSPLAARTGVALQFGAAHAGRAAADDAPWVMADRVRLRQVMVNLLSNALKYNRPGGSVRLDWTMTDGRCDLSIADTGLGMSGEQLAHLFEPFNRLGAERTGVEGTGIGLVLSRRIVEQMQGELSIESVFGRGTVARLRLGLADMPATAPGARAAPSAYGALDGRLDVLYAEDDEVNVELVRQAVRLRPTVDLRVAQNGATALAMAREAPPELMLVDMNLGDMTGLELAAALRAQPATAEIRLVALSADALPWQIETALARGFQAYLTKPIDFRQLLRVLDGRAPN